MDGIVRLCLIAIVLSLGLCDQRGNKDKEALIRNARITGGTDADYPFVVSIRKHNGSLVCGGLLIPVPRIKRNETKFIVTAAHCVCKGPGQPLDNYVDLRVVNGGDQTTERSQWANILEIETIVCYPSFNLTGQDENDIAIVQLKNTTAFANAGPNKVRWMYKEENPANKICTVVGWGRELLLLMADNTPVYSGVDHLKQMDVRIWSQRECNTDISKRFCFNGSGSPCTGDSGGPIFCNVNGEKLLVGLLTKGQVSHLNDRQQTEINCYPGNVAFGLRLSHYSAWASESVNRLDKGVKTLIGLHTSFRGECSREWEVPDDGHRPRGRDDPLPKAPRSTTRQRWTPNKAAIYATSRRTKSPNKGVTTRKSNAPVPQQREHGKEKGR